MDRLGCTEFCSWCGALCWGHASHDKNEDVTKKHHAAHQPMGLHGICDGGGRITAMSCEHMNEDIQVLKIQTDSEDGMNWGKIKQGIDFENWIFINDSIEDYRNLMALAFTKYNDRPAEKYGLQPCKKETLEFAGYFKLETRLEDIKTHIISRLQKPRYGSFESVDTHSINREVGESTRL